MVHSRFIKVLFFLVVGIGLLNAQNFDPISIPFEFNGVQLQNPLIGGLSAPQFESFDLDGEGPEDLIVFERNGNVLLPFINRSTPGNPNYIYAPEYTKKFPRLLQFVKFIDFNNDGKKDIFAQSPRGSAVEVWRNKSDSDLKFELMKFNFGLGDFLQITSGGDFTNLYVSNIDIPAILDVDGDGDVDILTFETGGSYMYYYKNMVKEMSLPDDTLVYRTVDLCWGNFLESGVDEEIILSDQRDDCAQFLQTQGNSGSRHAGSTVTVLDGDGDGDLDMLLGDISNTGLVYLENDEQDGDAFIVDQDVDFPSNSEEVDISIFISSFHIDVDNDGKKDLIVCPNNDLTADNMNHIWYYRNVGEGDAPVFELVQKNFLHETTLRMGNSSHPCFIDYNEDGLLDILVGMHFIYEDGQSTSISLYLYENIGTLDQPSYRLIDNDYLGLSGVVDEFIGYLTPAAGDLDGDGDTDLLISENRSKLIYFENVAGPGQPYAFDNFIFEYMGIKVGTNGKPQIIDLDGDGLSDIVLGESNSNGSPITGAGGVNFFKNIGTVGNPQFEKEEDVFPNTDVLGLIFTQVSGGTRGSSAPSFFYSEDRLMVAVGSNSGQIFLYDDIEDNLYGEFNLITDNLPIIHPGKRTSVAIADIDNDGYHEMIVGNDNGGLMAFNTDFKTGDSLSTQNPMNTFKVEITPNPANNLLKVVYTGGVTSETYSIISIDGRLIKRGSSDQLLQGLDIQDLTAGMYLLSLETNKGNLVEKFVKL